VALGVFFVLFSQGSGLQSSLFSCLTKQSVAESFKTGSILILLYTVELFSSPRDTISAHTFTPTMPRYMVYVIRRAAAIFRQKMSACVDDVSWRMRSNRVQLNTAKTGVLWCATSRRQHQKPHASVTILSRLPAGTWPGLLPGSRSFHEDSRFQNCVAVVRYIRGWHDNRYRGKTAVTNDLGNGKAFIKRCGNTAVGKGKGKGKYTWYSASSWNTTSEALRYGSYSVTCKLHRTCLYLVSIHQMAHPKLRLRTSNCSLLLIYLPRKDERLSWPGWLVT